MSNMTNGQQTTYPQDQTEELFAGSLPDAAHQTQHVRAFVNEEAASEIAFGVMVKQGTADDDAKLMAAQADHLVGIVVRSQAYSKDEELGSTGLKPNVSMSVLRKGRIWVEAVDAVTPSDPVRVHKTGGTFQTAAAVGDTVNISANANWLTSAGAGELALLEFDMTGLNTNKSSD